MKTELKIYLIFGFICTGVWGYFVYKKEDEADNHNTKLTVTYTGIAIMSLSLFWAISSYLYTKYSDGNILWSIILFTPIFDFMGAVLRI